jgi:hypothetical protein
MLSIGQMVKVASRWRSCSAFCECRAGVSQKAGLQRPPRLPAPAAARPEFCPGRNPVRHSAAYKTPQPCESQHRRRYACALCRLPLDRWSRRRFAGRGGQQARLGSLAPGGAKGRDQRLLRSPSSTQREENGRGAAGRSRLLAEASAVPVRQRDRVRPAARPLRPARARPVPSRTRFISPQQTSRVTPPRPK